MKACYFLEGDGPLALECYEAVEKVSTFLRIAHTPNVRAVAQQVSGALPPDPHHVQWVDYATKCVGPGVDYFQRQLVSSPKDSLAAFKSARLFHPSKAYVMQPDTAVIDELCSIPFLNFPPHILPSATLDSLKQELLARAAGVDPKFSALEWWRQNADDLSHWSSAAKKLLLLQPSSAAAEKVFSIHQTSSSHFCSLACIVYLGFNSRPSIYNLSRSSGGSHRFCRGLRPAYSFHHWAWEDSRSSRAR